MRHHILSWWMLKAWNSQSYSFYLLYVYTHIWDSLISKTKILNLVMQYFIVALLQLNILLNLRHCVLNFNCNSFHKLWNLWDSSFNAFNSLFEQSINFGRMTTIARRRTHDGILSRNALFSSNYIYLSAILF